MADPAPEPGLELGRRLTGRGSITFRDGGRELTVEGRVYARQLGPAWFAALDPGMRRRMDAFVGGVPEPAPEPDPPQRAAAGSRPGVGGGKDALA